MMNNIPQKPSTSKWTDEQWKAIYATGQNILVAAAAGSGKTAVLVTRIIEKIKQEEKGIDIDDLLIVTFTNAAAAEMKQRVANSLEKELNLHPDSLHLKKQITLLNQASISTLHSFCLNLIRKYYYQTDIDPDFRLIDSIEANILREEVMDVVFELEYQKEKNEDFFLLVDSLTDDRSDQALADTVSKLFDFSRANPNPDEWLNKVVAQYEMEGLNSIQELPYYSFIKDSLEFTIQQAIDLLQSALKLTKESTGPLDYLPVLEDDLNQLYKLDFTKNWQEISNQCNNIKFKRLPPLKNKEEYEEVCIEQVKKKRDDAKKAFNQLLTNWFKREEGRYLQDITAMKRNIETLVNLVRTFSAAFFKVKREKNVLDFDDLEHLALQILSENNHQEEGEIRPSEIAKQLKKQFKEVLVDEYQDTNMVQETILLLITQDKEKSGNLFMVGDVKQSIYRFRLADPNLFIDKYERYQLNGEKTGLRIDLTKNFRSRNEVLATTNFTFKQIMSQQIGEIDYNSTQELVLGSDFPKSDHCATEFLFIDMQKKENEKSQFNPEDLQKDQLEAQAIAQKIKQMINEKFPIYDKRKKEFRPIQYRDIVILSRTLTNATNIEEMMKDHDIPFYVNNTTGYFKATEIATIISFLKIIDNPYQDIPLASVLRSPIVGLNEEELGQIRANKNKGYFYEAIQSYISEVNSKTADRLEKFIDQLERFRELSIRKRLSGLIWQIYSETNFYEFVGGLPGGKQRQANLRALHDRAGQYEKTSFRGLFKFIRFIERLEKRGDDLGKAKISSEKEDVIRLMTIHSSKGLEFPIVILTGMNRKFNMRDVSDKILLDREYGFASNYVNVEKRFTYPTIMQQALRQKKYREMIAEEMRVLYVALTRAEEKLVLVGAVPEWDEKLQSWLKSADEALVLSASKRINAKSYLDWIGHTLVRHPQFYTDLHIQAPTFTKKIKTNMKLQIRAITKEELKVNSENKVDDKSFIQYLNKLKPVPIKSPYQSEIVQHLQSKYPDQVATTIRAKQSITELKREFSFQDNWSDSRFLKPIQPVSLRRPKFLQKKKRLTAAEAGTALHTVMQFIPLHIKPTKESILNLLDNLEKKELINSEERKTIKSQQILNFFESNLGKIVLKNAANIEREVPFTYLMPAKNLNEQASSRVKVMIQGMVDNMIIFEDQVILIDFKTDKINGRFLGGWKEAEKVMRKRYKVQIELYAEAIEAILKKPVLHAYLYFFDSQSICAFTKEDRK